MPDIVINNGLGVSITYSGISKVAFRSAENLGEMVDFGYGLPTYNPLKTYLENGLGLVFSYLSTITRVGPSMFAGVYERSTGPIISMPECSRIDDMGFGAYSWFNIGPSGYNMPKLTYVGNGAFQNGKCLSFYMPNVEYVGNYAFFRQKSARTTLIWSNLSYIGAGGFEYYGCYGGVSITFVFSNCATIGQYGFASCERLVECQIPKVSIIPSNAFYECSRLTNVDVTGATYLSEYAFIRCYALSRIDLPNCGRISYAAFYDCSSLNTVSIGTNLSYVATLYNSSVFSGTAITSTGGQIYVPSSLLTAYQSAAGWSYFSAIIHGV